MDSITVDIARRRDGRTVRADRSRSLIIAAARAKMLAGDFRPSIRSVAADAGCAVRTVFQHFTDVEGVHRAALDAETRDGIAALVNMGAVAPPSPADADRISFAAVFGRPILPK